MKKRVRIAVLALLFLAVSAGIIGRGGNTWGVKRIVGESRYFQYSAKDIRNAMDLVERKFRRDFEGCKLLRLEYDESKTLAEQLEREKYDGVKRTMVLLSDFYVGFGAEPSLNPNDTYRNWKWILTDDGSGWELRTWGYG